MADYSLVQEGLKRGYSLDEIADTLARDQGFDPSEIRSRGYSANEMLAKFGYIEPTPEPVKPKERSWGEAALDTAKDVGISAVKSAIAVPELAVGIGNVFTGGAVGKAVEGAGVRFKDAKEILDSGYSDYQKARNAEVQQAEGFIDTTKAMLTNPSTIAHAGIESASTMGAGGLIGRGLLAVAPRAIGALSGVAGTSANVVAGAAGEGIAGMGSAAESIRQSTSDGYLTGKQTLSAGLSGVGTSVLGVAGGKLANKLGIDDIDSMIVKGAGTAEGAEAAAIKKGLMRRVAEGGISEGVFEELPQSVQEQMWQNYATDRPIMEGVDKAAAAGMLVGAAMGGGANLLTSVSPPRPKPEDITKAPTTDEAINMFNAAVDTDTNAPPLLESIDKQLAELEAATAPLATPEVTELTNTQVQNMAAQMPVTPTPEPAPGARQMLANVRSAIEAGDPNHPIVGIARRELGDAAVDQQITAVRSPAMLNTLEQRAATNASTPPIRYTTNATGTHLLTTESAEQTAAITQALKDAGVSVHTVANTDSGAQIRLNKNTDLNVVNMALSRVNTRFTPSRSDFSADILAAEGGLPQEIANGPQATEAFTQQAQQPAPAAAAPAPVLTGDASSPQVAVLQRNMPSAVNLRVHTSDQLGSEVDGLSTGTMSKWRAKTIEGVARMFGKRVTFFSADNQIADGMNIRGDGTLYVNIKSGIDPLAVVGHEWRHTLATTNKAAHDAIQSAAGAILQATPGKLLEFASSYHSSEMADPDVAARIERIKAGTQTQEDVDFLAEEYSADVTGNIWRNTDMMREVFRDIMASHPEGVARTLIQKIGDAAITLIDKLYLSTGKKGFDEFGMDAKELKNEVKRAMVDAFNGRLGKPQQGTGSQEQGDAQMSTPRIRRSVDDLVKAAESQSDWRTWYDRHEQTIKDLFGSDADLFQSILSATSQATGVKGNVTLALKAYDQLLSGKPFEGFLPAVIKNLQRIRDSEKLKGAKISQYGEANEGNTDAIAVDRHIAMLFFNVKTPSARQITAAKDRIRTIAGRLGWEPRQVQAALWAYNQVRLGTDPSKVQSYDTILEARAAEVAKLRSNLGRGEAGSNGADGDTGGGAESRPTGFGQAGETTRLEGGRFVSLKEASRFADQGKLYDSKQRALFSNSRADHKVNPDNIPEFRFADYIGRAIFPTIADRTAAGGDYTGIDGAGSAPIQQQGGPGFPSLSRNWIKNLIWASDGKGVVSQKANLISKHGKPLMAVTLGQLEMHSSNATSVLAYLKTLEAYIGAGRVKLDQLTSVTEAIRGLKLAKEYKVDELATFPGFDDVKKLDAYIDSASFAARAGIVKELGKARSEAVGLPSADKVIRKLTDQEYAGNRHFDTVLILEPNETDNFIKLGEDGTDEHLSYTYGIKGKVIGKLSTPINAREIWADWFAQKQIEKRAEKAMMLEVYNGDKTIEDLKALIKREDYDTKSNWSQAVKGIAEQYEKLIGNKNNLEKLKAKDFDALISLDRSFALSMPAINITEDMAKRLDAIGSKPAPNAATTRAAIDFANDNWSTSDKAVKNGGVSPADFARELTQSDASATLTLYTEQELKDGIKAKTMRLFRLGEQRIVFALKKGAPDLYGLDSLPGVTDNEVSLVSVVNNAQGVKGIGGPAVMIKAISEGATFLDCFSVKTERFPNGFLPTMYAEYGFKEVGRQKFDPQYLTEDHKYAWKQNGWKETDDLPDVVFMKWQGDENERAGLLQRYLEQGEGSLRAGTAGARTATAKYAEQDAGPSTRRAGRKADSSSGDRGIQGAGDRTSLASGAKRVVDQVKGLDDDQLRNLGVERSSIKFSPERILNDAGITGRERLDALKDVRSGVITAEELAAAYPSKSTDDSKHGTDAQPEADPPKQKFSLRRKEDPKKTVKAYKLFRMDKNQPGKIFPLFVDANTPVEMGVWIDAIEGEMKGDKVKSKIGPLAYRPGWHAGDVPVATHIGGKSDSTLTAPDRRPDNHVWAEVEMAADRDWQTIANERGTNKDGKLIPVRAHITDQLPVDGYYRYKTNSNMTGNWLIGGSMKVTRLLSDFEVMAINGESESGVQDLERDTDLDLEKYGFDVAKMSTARDTQKMQAVAEAWQELAKNDKLFTYPKSDSKDFDTIVRTIDPTLRLGESIRDKSGETIYVVRSSDPTMAGKSAMMMVKNDVVKLDILNWGQGAGGSKVYAAVANYAYNNDKVFHEDDALSDNSIFRRTENMLATALKFGTTRHIAPGKFLLRGSESSRVEPLKWEAGNDAANMRSLIETTYQNVINHAPGLANVTFNFKTGEFERDSDGSTVTDDDLRKFAGTANARAGKAGFATLKRVIVTNTLLRQADSGGRGSLLDQLGDGGTMRDGLPARLENASYSLPRIDAQRDWYYSQLSNAVTKLPAKVANGNSAAVWLQANAANLGVKKDELEWSGVLDWLRIKGKQPVNSEDIQVFLRDNGVRVQEQTLGDSDKYVVREAGNEESKYFDSEDEATEYIDEMVDASVADQSESSWNDDDWDYARSQEKERFITYEPGEWRGTAKYGQYTLPGGQNYREVLLTLPSKGNDGYTSSHWEQENVLAHIRLNDRQDADGNKVLFVEEVQSDAGQDKRKGKTTWNAPFINNTEGWLNLALKRVIAIAAEGDYDKVAFVNGEQSADRYDLSKQVQQVMAKKEGDEFIIFVRDSAGKNHNMGIRSANELPDVVGKELAEKITSQKKEMDIYEGLDLKVGGEGMKAFYDSIVPNTVKALLKKLGGGQMESIDLTNSADDFDEMELDSATDEELAQLEATGRVGGLTQPGFAITDGLRKSASGGMPLFSPARFTVSEPSQMDNMLRVMQDKHVDLRRALEAVKEQYGVIADKWDTYLQEELFHGRAAKGVSDFLDKELRPLLVEMKARGLDFDKVEEYLWYRHAGERNAQVAKVNPNMPDGGSGKTAAEIAAYFANLSTSERNRLDGVAKRVDAINKETQKWLVISGLETQDTIDAWNATYQHYVPLQREGMDTGMFPGNGNGKGFGIRGAFAKRAMGSEKAVENIISNIAMQRERAIVRAEKNRVSQSMYGLAITSPNPDLWTAVKPSGNPADLVKMLVSAGINPIDANNMSKAPTERWINPKTGLVEDRVNPLWTSNPNVLALRVNGEQRYVVFNENSERGRNIAIAMKNLDAEQLGRLMGIISKGTRWFASVNTQYNPIFGITNLTRDTGGVALNLSTTPLKGREAEVLKQIGPAWLGIYSDLRAARKGKTATSAWAQTFEEFTESGGKTGYRDQFLNSTERMEEIASEFKQLSEGKLKSGARGIFNWLSDYNDAMENSTRLATYKVARDSGMSKEQAASLAKNITVNFNRKGTAATQAGALYAFFNASVQGTARLTETLKGPRGKQIALGGLTLGVMNAAMLAMAGFDDDDPPEYVRERNIVIPIGLLTGRDKSFISIPIPLGFHVIPNTGRIATEWAMSGFKDTPKRIMSLGASLFEAFNPIGSSGLSVQTIAPTVTDPLVALTENRDWTGKKIAKEDFNSLNPTPGHTRAKDTATFLSRQLSYALNYMSGGTEFKKGAVSPTPDQIDYLAGQIGGGVWRELSKLEQSVEGAITGETAPVHKIPLLGRFYGEASGATHEGGAYYKNIVEINEHQSEIDGLRKSGRGAEATKYIAENPTAALVKTADRIESEIAKYKKQKRDMIARNAPASQVRLQEQRITAAMKRLNDQVRRLEGKQVEDATN
jgi:hypothetical protein